MRSLVAAVLSLAILGAAVSAVRTVGAPATIAELYIPHPSISPNGDGRIDSSPLEITTFEWCDTIAVTLEDAGGALVIDTLLFETDAPAGSYAAEWDGADASGSPLAEGDYTLRIAASNADTTEEDTRTVVVDLTPPPPPSIEPPYSPLSDPELSLEVTYDEAMTDSFFVNRGYGGGVETQRIAAAPIVAVTLEEGENAIWLEAGDEAGNTSDPSDVVTVVYDPAVGIFYPEVFSGPALFRVSTAADAEKARIDIYTVSGDHVVTLKQSGPARSFQLEWDLTNGDGEQVRNGAYLAVISVFQGGSKRVEKNFIAVVR